MKRRNSGVLFLALAVVCGLLASLLSVNYLRDRQTTIEVVVMREEVAPFTELSTAMLSTATVPADALQGDELTSADEAKGRFSRTLLLSGTVLRRGHLAESGLASLTTRLTEAKEPDKRAFALPIDPATGVGGTLRPGDKVDIIAAVKMEQPGSEESQSVALAKVIARNIEVLHLAEPKEGSKGGVAVLKVSPALAEEIAFAYTAGSVWLASNPYETDLTAAETQGVTAEQFLAKYGVTASSAEDQGKTAKEGGLTYGR